MERQGFSIGPYSVTRRLGAGGMGEVWLAERGGKRMVLKTILPHLASTPRFHELFLREADIAARIRSPRVVQLIEAGETADCLYLALEYVDGVSLQELMHSYGGPLPPEWVAYIGAEIARALDDVHGQRDDTGESLGILHRDVSPGNVLVSREGELKLTDFGIARMAEGTGSSATTVGNIQGKARYMSPEQASGETLDTRSDLYSLGVMLYRLACGETPFSASNDVAVLQQIIHGQSVPLLEQDPHLPPRLAEVIERARAHVSARRYPSAQELVRALEEAVPPESQRAAKGELAQLLADLKPAAPPPDVTRGSPPQEHSRGRRWLGPAAGLASCAVTAALYFGLHRPPTRTPPVAQPTPVTVSPLPSVASSAPTPIPPEPEPEPSHPVPPHPTPARAPHPHARKPTPPSHEVLVDAQPACSVWLGKHNLGMTPQVVHFPGPTQPVTLISESSGIHYDQVLSAEGPARVTVKIPRGTLHVRIYPYSDLTMDGTPLGEGPYAVLPVYAGRHQLQIENRQLGTHRDQQVVVAPNEQKVVRIDMSGPPAGK